MNEMKTNPKVDWLFNKDSQWQQEYAALRSVILECGLNEELKWGQPCYTYQSKNVVLIHGFKEYCALLFFKGALLHDGNGLLIQQTENVQATRQLRFTDVKDIVALRNTIKSYIFQAIEVEKAGLKVVLKKTADYPIPEEFQTRLDEMPPLRTAFEALTPGRQRAYLHYFSQAKQAKTRVSRVEKYIPHILQGKGLADQ